MPTPLIIRFVHLAGLYPSHFWTIGEKSKRWERVERKPKTLQPLMYALADDLLHWEDGDWAADYSVDAEEPDRLFFLRCILLYWCGDYPGQGEASGFSHSSHSSKACHWCLDSSTYSTGLHRAVFSGYERYAPRFLFILTTFATHTRTRALQVASPRSSTQSHLQGCARTPDPCCLMPARPGI